MNRVLFAVLRMVPMAAVMGTIFILSATPGDRLKLSDLPGIDKLGHIFAYGVLALTALFAFSEDRKKKQLKLVILLTVTFCVAYGISDEIHQAFVPGRSPSIFDIVADAVGAVMATVLYTLWRERRGTLLRL